MNDENTPAIEAETEAKRAPGRPRGYPRSGGRPKGAKNRLPEEFRAYIDARGRPLELLSAIARGNKVTAADPADPTRKIRVYPGLADRVAAARALMDRLLPALKAVETTGTGAGNHMKVVIGREDAALLGPDNNLKDLQLARQVAFMLTSGVEAQKSLEASGFAHLIEDGDKALLAGATAMIEAAPEEQPAPTPVGTEDEGDFVVRLAERLSDGRERWEARSKTGVVLGTGFDRDSLTARIRATQGR
jgi:hypothetical protein